MSRGVVDTAGATGRVRWSGIALAGAGVIAFSATLPVNSLALAGLAPLHVTVWRALLAGLVAVGYLLIVRADLPPRGLWPSLIGSGLLVAVGFPLFSSVALTTIDPARAAMILGLLPLITAVLASIVRRQPLPWRFWGVAAAGALVLVIYLATRSRGSELSVGDGIMLLGTICTAAGFVIAVNATASMGPLRVLSWGLVAVLPLSLPAGIVTLVVGIPVSTVSVTGLAYLGVVSQFVGFGLWYAGLARGGIARTAQIQQVQPILTIAITGLLFDGVVDGMTVVVGLVVCALAALAQFAGRPAPTTAAS